MTDLDLKRVLLACAIAFGAAGTAFAQAEQAPAATPEPAAAPEASAEELPPPEVQLKQALEGAGYTKVANVGQKGEGVWIANATTSDGRDVAIEVGKDGQVKETPREE